MKVKLSASEEKIIYHLMLIGSFETPTEVSREDNRVNKAVSKLTKEGIIKKEKGRYDFNENNPAFPIFMHLKEEINRLPENTKILLKRLVKLRGGKEKVKFYDDLGLNKTHPNLSDEEKNKFIDGLLIDQNKLNDVANLMDKSIKVDY